MVDMVLTEVRPAAELEPQAEFDFRAQLDEAAVMPAPVSGAVETAELPTRMLATDEYLFREGDPKHHAYRVESGALCVTARGPDGKPEFIELAFPGDLVGLGFLDQHADSAAALTETKVSVWSRQALPVLCQASPEAEARQASATAREFIYRRRQLTAGAASDPLKRVAAFLMVVSRLNEIEGRDPGVISEALRSGEVAQFLGMDIDTLGSQLVELQRRGLVALTDRGGLKLHKRVELDVLSGSAP
jgi:CRP/FNR family transcriptional regulator